MHFALPGPDRWKERSRTLLGIAEACAEQWGKYGTIADVRGVVSVGIPVGTGLPILNRDVRSRVDSDGSLDVSI